MGPPPEQRDAAGTTARAEEAGMEAAVGMSTDDLAKLRTFLARDRNDLAMVEIHKEVDWPDWEELATNIKLRIRQRGFQGIITVRRSNPEVMTVYKNRPWANFLHSRITKVICALSIVGWFVYQPYMWLRNRSLVLHSKFRVDVTIGSYWPLIADKLGPDGFDPSSSSVRP